MHNSGKGERERERERERKFVEKSKGIPHFSSSRELAEATVSKKRQGQKREEGRRERRRCRRAVTDRPACQHAERGRPFRRD